MASFQMSQMSGTRVGRVGLLPPMRSPLNVECSKCGKSWRFFYQHKFCPKCGEPVAKQGAKTEACASQTRKGLADVCSHRASFIKVKYGVVGTRMREVVRAAKDVGGGGIRFPVNKRLPHGAKLDLELILLMKPCHSARRPSHLEPRAFVVAGRMRRACQSPELTRWNRGKLIRRVHQALQRP